MTNIIAIVNGEEVEVEIDLPKLQAVTEFVARHYCGEFFFKERPSSAKEIAQIVLKRKGEVSYETDFDGFAFNNVPNGYPVKIEIVV